MNQDDIFKLLLILLLTSNEKENCLDCCDGRFSNLNEIIIIFLLFGAFSSSGRGDRRLELVERSRLNNGECCDDTV